MISPFASAAATRSASKDSWMTAAVPYSAERVRIERPPTWKSGSTHSQRSSGATPRFQAEATALASKFA